MLKKTITYTNFNDEEVTEDFYFNLSKAEIAELELSQKGGLEAHIRRIAAAEDGREILSSFKEILTTSIGRRSEDGKRFIKNQEIIDEFMQTNAYSELFLELVTDAKAATDFVNGVVPKDLKEGGVIKELPSPDDDDAPDYIKERRQPTQKELAAMSREELQVAFRYKIGLDKESRSDDE